ncbi:hypothetical protein EZ313_14795 [Ramlibacter henchirensis]|uniref:Uncharacterized protein n=1 Tax=Ramlibacter henchirensis TaxID=204072 RepID=A0A4Z0BTA7_9BURK|nr:hypothetical protein [Ramlibacter henchirensis]TFZ02526.1 hypothetical protein EZ313_14795 [Ramlibacter henchirensis]
MNPQQIYVVAQERHLSDISDPDDSPVDPAIDQIEVDICADSPLRIESMPDGGLHITCYQLVGQQELVAMLLRFTPEAAANLIGGLYRAIEAGEIGLRGEEPPPH